MGSILQLLIVMMCSQNYIRNPYLLAKLVEVIFVMQPAVQPLAAKINQALLMHELALNYLTPALMQFYVGMLAFWSLFLSLEVCLSLFHR
jgi:ubiquitin conjugation factor E4 B